MPKLNSFICKVQVVGYLHTHYPTGAAAVKDYGGDFVYYGQNSPDGSLMHPIPRSGALIDGSKTVHAAQVIQENAHML